MNMEYVGRIARAAGMIAVPGYGDREVYHHVHEIWSEEPNWLRHTKAAIATAMTGALRIGAEGLLVYNLIR